MEQELFYSFQKGEERGFAYFFRLYYRELVFFAGHLVRDRGVAEDIVVESFIKFFEKRTSLQGLETVKGFLYVSVRNAALSHLKTLKNQKAHQKEFGYLSIPEEQEVFREMVSSDVVAQVLAALNDLPAACQKVFRLYYFENKTYREIATQLGISEHTVRNQKARGRYLLKKKLPGF